MEKQLYQKLFQILPKENIKINEPMSNHTSLHIGGAADYFVMPETAKQLQDVVRLCIGTGVNYDIMGNGSNLLVADHGYRGVMIRLGENYSNVSYKGDCSITAQGGVLLSRLACIAADHGLTGFEFASGIPGTLGGAITMNAGAYGGEMKQCITGARVMNQEGSILELTLDELKLGYRSSVLQAEDYILLEADLTLAEGEQLEIREKMKELNTQRREKQPLDQYSAGSTFKRPAGYFAGKLISDAGLCGYQVGGAAVSEKHCGFVINKNNATAEEFLAVINDVIRIVYDKFGVRLEPEVRFLGEFQ